MGTIENIQALNGIPDEFFDKLEELGSRKLQEDIEAAKGYNFEQGHPLSGDIGDERMYQYLVGDMWNALGRINVLNLPLSAQGVIERAPVRIDLHSLLNSEYDIDVMMLVLLVSERAASAIFIPKNEDEYFDIDGLDFTIDDIISEEEAYAIFREHLTEDFPDGAAPYYSCGTRDLDEVMAEIYESKIKNMSPSIQKRLPKSLFEPYITQHRDRHLDLSRAKFMDTLRRWGCAACIRKLKEDGPPEKYDWNEPCEQP